MLIFLLSACSSDNRLDGFVYFRLNSNPSTLDPALVTDVAGGTISAKLFNGLVRLSEDLKIIPDISHKWTISKNGLKYTFYLRKDVKFHSGRTVTAHDFKYSFERVLNPKTKSPNTWVLDRLKGAREFSKGVSNEVIGIIVKDDYTLELRLAQPFSPFLQLLTMTPAYVVSKEDVERLGLDFSSHPVGTGPFKLTEWLPNREIRIEASNDYFETPAQVKGIVYRIIPEDLTTVAEFELGNLDAMAVPASEYSRYKKSEKYKALLLSLKGINTYYLGLNCSRPPFDNTELRRAINYAIDREKILRTIYEGRGRIAYGPLPDVLRKWPSPVLYPYDPDKARKIIAKLKPPAVNFYVTADQEVVDIAEVIQSYLKAVGLDVKIKQLEWSAYKQAINNGETDMFWLSWWADYPDPENFLFPLFHSSNHGASGNRARYTNHDVDKLIELGQNSLNESKRDKYYEDAERLIVSDAPWVFFWHKTDYVLRQPWVEGFKMYFVYSMDKGTGLRIKKEK